MNEPLKEFSFGLGKTKFLQSFAHNDKKYSFSQRRQWISLIYFRLRFNQIATQKAMIKPLDTIAKIANKFAGWILLFAHAGLRANTQKIMTNKYFCILNLINFLLYIALLCKLNFYK